MRKTIITLLVAGLTSLALPAMATENPECLSSGIDYTTDTPHLTNTMEHRDDGAIRIGMVGTFFWLVLNNTGERGLILGDVLSIEVPLEAVFVEACMNGNVTFTFASVEPTPDAEIAPAVQVTNLWDYWADYEWEPFLLCESGPC